MSYINLNDNKWDVLPIKDDSPLLHWHDNCGVYLSFNLKPFHSSDHIEYDIEKIRLHKRECLAEHNFGVVECDFRKIDNLECLVTICKHIESPPRAVYMSETILQFPKLKAIFCMRAQEDGITGMREAHAFAEKYKEWKGDCGPEELAKSMIYDRYFPHLYGHSLYCESDSEIFDDIFPDHPLTKIRSNTKTLLERTSFSRSFIRQLHGSNKSWWKFW